MRTTSFMSFSQKYASAMAGRNVPVTFGGAMAWTDNKRINLPALPAGTMLTPWEAKVLTGYLDHEVGHLRYTDWGPDFVSRPTPGSEDYKKNLLTHHLFNVFEDVREENAFIKEMPPVKNYLDAVEQHLQNLGLERTEEPTTGAQVLAAIYHEAYRYRNPDVSYNPGPRLEQFPELAPIKDAMQAVGTLGSTKDAGELAKKIYELLPKDVDYGGPAKSPDGLGTISLGTAPSSGQTTTLVIPAAFPGDLPHSSPPNSLETRLAELLNGLTGQPPPATPSQEIQMPLATIEAAIEQANRPDALKQLLEAIKQANDPHSHTTEREKRSWGDSILPPAGTSHDRTFVPTEKDSRAYEATRLRASPQITAAKKMLTLALRARTKRAWEKGLPEGELDHDALHLLFSPKPSPNLFKERRDTTLVDTAVQLMVDLSGSMDTEATRTAAIILAEAMQSIRGLKLGIAGFTTGRHHYLPKNPQGTGRTVNLEIPLFKDFEEPFSAVRDRLGALQCSYHTPLGEAYALGMERLFPRKEPRRVLWLITDGAPNVPKADLRHSELKLMEKCHRRCQEAKIKTVMFNIGRMNAAAAKLADVCKAVQTHQELPAALLEAAKAMIL